YITIGDNYTGAVFDLLGNFDFDLPPGCARSAIESKFLQLRLDKFVPSTLVKSLFKDIGVTIRQSDIARIASLSSAVCAEDPPNVLGFLMLEAQVEVVPR